MKFKIIIKIILQKTKIKIQITKIIKNKQLNKFKLMILLKPKYTFIILRMDAYKINFLNKIMKLMKKLISYFYFMQ